MSLINSKKKIKIGVVGLGVGEQHLLALRNNFSCSVSCIYDLNFTKAKNLSTKFAGCSAVNSYDNLLSQVDAVVLASFDDDHFNQTLTAIKSGKHVFVEKPMCRSLYELKAIKKAWGNCCGKIKLHSNLILRTAPLYQWLKAQIQDNNLGEVYSFDGDYLYGRIHKIIEGWRSQVPNYSVMEGGGIHLLDLLLWITEDRPTSVFASGNKISTQSTAFHYNDFTAATFEFSSGLIARITANYGIVHPHQHLMRICGTKGTFIYDDKGPRLVNSRLPGTLPNEITYSPFPISKGDLTPAFIKSILEDTDDTKLTQSYFDGISACIAADKSVTTGRKEPIVYV